ncbi:MAG: hypothetical protein ACRBN8_42705 [Nannocystales bacterium]
MLDLYAWTHKLKPRCGRGLGGATALLVALQSNPAHAAAPSAEDRAAAEDRYDRTDRSLVGATAAQAGGAGVLLLAGVALHISASAKEKEKECGDLDDTSLDVSGIQACQQAVTRATGRNVAFIGVGLAGVGAIVTGVLLARHRRRGVQRFAITGDGFRLRF